MGWEEKTPAKKLIPGVRYGFLSDHTRTQFEIKNDGSVVIFNRE